VEECLLHLSWSFDDDRRFFNLLDVYFWREDSTKYWEMSTVSKLMEFSKYVQVLHTIQTYYSLTVI
jgi:hypothetical protein